jgi:tryptophan-rich sensory protein
MELVKSAGAVGASVGIALALTFRNKTREADADADAESAWLESSWPRWGLPRKLFAGVWLSVMYPILAYVVISLTNTCDDKLVWAAIALHLVSNAIWVPAFVRWQTATIAVVNALLMVLSAAWIAIKFADALRLHARVMLWVYVAWVAYSASITSNFLFAESS